MTSPAGRCSMSPSEKKQSQRNGRYTISGRWTGNQMWWPIISESSLLTRRLAQPPAARLFNPTNKHIPNNPNPNTNPNTYETSWTTLGLVLGLGLLFLFSEYDYWFSTQRRHGVTWFDLLWTAATTRPPLSLSDLDSSLVLSCACSISDITVDVGRE